MWSCVCMVLCMCFQHVDWHYWLIITMFIFWMFFFQSIDSNLPVDFLLKSFCFALLFSILSAAFTLLLKWQWRITIGPAHSDHRESISWHVLMPWSAPVFGSVSVPMALGRSGGMKEPLRQCQPQMPFTTTHPGHRLLCLHSPLTLSGPGPMQICRWPH